MLCIKCGAFTLGRYVCGPCRREEEQIKKGKSKSDREYIFEIKGLKYRQQLKAEDNYTCLLCGKTEQEENKKFHIHHIDIRNEQDYGWDSKKIRKKLITVCPKCHKQIHSTLKYYKLKDLKLVTRDNFKEWFNEQLIKINKTFNSN